MTVRLLHAGEVIGRPGRRAIQLTLESLKDELGADFVVINGEHLAGGFGVSRDVLQTLEALPIDCITSGNHIWDKKDGVSLLDQRSDLLRPSNYPKGNPGKGLFEGKTASGVPVAVINLEGQAFMKPLPSPFEEADRLLAALGNEFKIILVDFHAEATSEKQAMGFYLDGRVSAVIGTHTHVPTADGRVLPGGTALQTDVGLTGPYESIIGFRADKVLERFARHRKAPFEVAKRDLRVACCIVDVDETTGKATHVEHRLIPVDVG